MLLRVGITGLSTNIRSVRPKLHLHEHVWDTLGNFGQLDEKILNQEFYSFLLFHCQIRANFRYIGTCNSMYKSLSNCFKS